MERKWNVFVIEHSHTDIGYTQRQERITRYHQNFIRQAMKILDLVHQGMRPDYNGFKWQCENYWQVEEFFRVASDEEKKRFISYVKSGEIGLSGNYLNLCELIDAEVLDLYLQKAELFGKEIGFPIRSAMTADINGYAWGYADALYAHGVRNFISCLHSHHGMFVTNQKQRPFFWETPKRERLLVWMGDHYHLGNDLMLSPHTQLSYMIKDRFTYDMDHRMFRDDAETTERQEIEIAEFRIKNYLARLEREGYAWDFLPVMVSGAMTDNACPSGAVAGRLQKLNQIFSGDVNFQMATLDTFFDKVWENKEDIPVFRGDWPDWWADGVGSTPAVVKLLRSAQRKYHICQKLDGENQLGNAALMEQAAHNIMLYTEHTWGYSASVSEPWSTMVNELDLRNTGYAVQADAAASENLDQILAEKGEGVIAVGRPLRYKVINPHAHEVTEMAALYVDQWEYLNGTAFDPDLLYEVYDEETGEVFACQCELEARGYRMEVQITLKPGEERILCIRIAEKAADITTSNINVSAGTDGVKDIQYPTVMEMPFYIENDFLSVIIEEEKGITSVWDKRRNRELLRQDALPLFTAVYEKTSFGKEAPEKVRLHMGRNRKSMKTKRYTAKLLDSRIVQSGPLYTALVLDYCLEGTKYLQLYLKIYKKLPRMEAEVRLHKESVWEPENLYLALPFQLDEEEKYIDKTGCILRPGLDQLPGSNQEFYLLQNGIVLQGKDETMIIGMPDVPLVVFGDLKAKPIRLCGGNNRELNQSVCYSWLMNNFWETNFKAELGGFYSFTYSFDLFEKTEVTCAFQFCKERNEGILVLRMSE